MRAILPLSAAALALSLAACNSNSNDTATPAATEEASADAMPADAGASDAVMADSGMASTPQGFADTMAASDMFEIESSKLAQSMGKSAAVKSFAAMMVKDHTKSSADLKAAAGKASPAVTVKPEMTAGQRAELDALKNAGDNFDTLYAQKQVAGHEKALAALQGYAANGADAALKDFASKTAPVVEGHLGQAKKLP